VTRRRLRLSFRTRLGLTITLVFIAAGAGLLAAQFLVVQQLFAHAIQLTTITCQGGAIGPQLSDPGGELPKGCIASGTESGGSPDQGLNVVGGAVIQQTVFLSQQVVGGLFIWSVVLLVVFAAIAAAIAFWLSRRSLDRIGEVTSAARDISERDLGRRLLLPGPDDEIKELGDTFDGMLDRLQLAFAAQDRFVANASHELRTPLTTTRAALEIPLEHGDVPAELQPAIRRALRATDQSERLIAALLTLARSGARIEHPEVIDLADVATEERDELADAAAARGVRVHTEAVAAEVEGDPVLLSRAVLNLLDNAIRHNRKKGELWLRTGAEGGTAWVEVESSGEQLDEQTIGMLGEPFYRGRRTRTAASEGVGLGLAIVQSITATHGGTLTLAAREGGGLIARLSIPSHPVRVE
jgi:signal transduction histidine kinase